MRRTSHSPTIEKKTYNWNSQAATKIIKKMIMDVDFIMVEYNKKSKNRSQRICRCSIKRFECTLVIINHYPPLTISRSRKRQDIIIEEIFQRMSGIVRKQPFFSTFGWNTIKVESYVDLVATR